jgi:CYTH domain-containing protein
LPTGVVLGQAAFLTIKSPKYDRACKEYEYQIPVTDAQEMMKHCRHTIKKERYYVPLTEYNKTTESVADHLWFEVDVFGAAQHGLCIAELECPSDFMLDTELLPSWIGKDVSSEQRLSNAVLSRDPDVVTSVLPMDRVRMLPLWLWYDVDPAGGTLSRSSECVPGFRVGNVKFHSETHREIAQDIVRYMNELDHKWDNKFRALVQRTRVSTIAGVGATGTAAPMYMYQLAGTAITHRYKEYTTQAIRTHGKGAVSESRVLFDIDDLGVGFPLTRAQHTTPMNEDTKHAPEPVCLLMPEPWLLREVARCFLAEYMYLTPSGFDPSK